MSPRLRKGYERGRNKPERVLTNEGIIEGREDTGDAEDKFAYLKGFVSILKGRAGMIGITFADLGAKRDVLGGSTLYFFLRRHVEGISSRVFAEVAEFSTQDK